MDKYEYTVRLDDIHKLMKVTISRQQNWQIPSTGDVSKVS